MSYPIVRLRPRLDAKPWGGRRLASSLAVAPDAAGPIGEAVYTGRGATVDGGQLDGAALADLVAADPEGWCGARGSRATSGRPEFPLLAKVIDAAEHLSIQVHPDDAGAAAFDSLGKTEAWHVLAAEPDGVIFAGLLASDGADAFARSCVAADGSAAGHLRRVAVRPGETYFLPAGTVHALGAGVVVFEIQQPSELTLRLDDWGRLGLDGKPRELHLDTGIPAIVPPACPEALPRLPLAEGAVRRDALTACPYFALERVAFPVGGATILEAPDSPQVLFCLEGRTTLAAPEGDPADAGSDATAGVTLGRWETAVAAARAGAVAITAEPGSVLLRAWVPDLESEIVAPARERGWDAARLAPLGVPAPIPSAS